MLHHLQNKKKKEDAGRNKGVVLLFVSSSLRPVFVGRFLFFILNLPSNDCCVNSAPSHVHPFADDCVIDYKAVIVLTKFDGNANDIFLFKPGSTAC